MLISENKKILEKLKDTNSKTHNFDAEIKELEDNIQEQENLVKELVEQCENLNYKTDCSKIDDIVNKLLLKYYSNVNNLYYDARQYIKGKKYSNGIKSILRVFIHLAVDEDLEYFDLATTNPDFILSDHEIYQWEGDQLLGFRD